MRGYSSYINTAFLSFVFLFATATGMAQKVTTVEPDKEKKSEGNKSESLYYDAVKAEMLDDDREAVKLFEEFVEKNPKESAGYYELSRLYVKQKNDEKAEEYIKKAIALDNDNKWYKEQYASVLTNRNEYEKAADVIMELAKKDDHNHAYSLTAAMLYERDGRYERALGVFDNLLKDAPNDEDLLTQKMQIYLKMNDADNAAKVGERLVQVNPREGKYYAMLAELYDNNKQPAKAAEVLQRGQTAIPDDATIQFSWAEHYRRQNDSTKSNEYIRKVITNKDQDVETQLALLTGYLQDLSTDSAKKAEGLSLAKQLADQHPNNARVIATYGDLLTINNKRNEAAEQYKRSLAINPAAFPVWQQLLFTYYADRNTADSLIKYSEKAMRYFPNQAIVYFLNGAGQFNKKNYTNAIKSLNHGIDIQPDDSLGILGDMYGMLGDTYNILKEYARSDSAFEKVLQLEPTNASVMNNYAYYLSVRNANLDKAEKLSKRSLELKPDEATFLDTYGWILYQQHKYKDAKDYIQKAVDANPDNADGTLYEHLGNVYYKLGDKEKAIQYWKKAKDKGSDNTQLDKQIQEQKLYE